MSIVLLQPRSEASRVQSAWQWMTAVPTALWGADHNPPQLIVHETACSLLCPFQA